VALSFDRDVDPAMATRLVGKKVVYFESDTIKRDGKSSPPPSGAIQIAGARVTDAGRTLLLATDPHPRIASYVLPNIAAKVDGAARNSAVDAIRYDLSGVEASWTPDGSPGDKPEWTGWWPVLDLETTRGLTRGSKRHEDGLKLLAKPGRLILSTLLRLPPGAAKVGVSSSQPIEEAVLGEAPADLTEPVPAAHRHRARWEVQSRDEPIFFSITCRTGDSGTPFSLSAAYGMGNAPSDQQFSRDQLWLPWAPMPAPAAGAPLVVPDLSGGDPVRGKTVFASEQARCAQCHAFRGQGGKLGPDLTDVATKGSAEVYRAIAAPSAIIAPEYAAYSVATRSGQVFVGVVRAAGADTIQVTDTTAHVTPISRGEIEQIRPSANSIMPVGLTGALGDASVRDLIAYLTSPPP
jgi:putative heme-binding domain-containing protein